MKVSGTVVVLLIVLVVVILFLAGGCTLRCNKREGYKRTCLAQDTCDLKRTPVDYVEKNCNGLRNDPHWMANPGHKYQPFHTAGKMELFEGAKRLAEGKLFSEFGQYYKGCGSGPVYLPNDEKTRFDLTNLGDLSTVRKLQDMTQDADYGPMVPAQRPVSHVSPFQPIYFGHMSRLRE